MTGCKNTIRWNTFVVMFQAILLIACLYAQAAHGQKAPSKDTPVKFDGRNRIVLIGTLRDKGPRQRVYSLYNRKAGQHMKITLKDFRPRGTPLPGFVTMYHITFPSGKKEGMKGYDPYGGKLPERGLYHITVQINNMISGEPSGRYSLTLTR